MLTRAPRSVRRALAICLALEFAVFGAAWLVAVSAAPAHAATPLNGLFRITAGACSGGVATGSYIRMILPSGGASGPYMSNADSICPDQTFTLLRAGTDGGLVSGSYQVSPSPAFDLAGNATAGRITAPAPYYGTAFATSTNGKDLQSGAAAPVSQIYVDGTTLSGNLSAFVVSWNKQFFNQGSPKPGGGYPGNTRAVSGSYNPATHAFALDWASQVSGGPFDKFTGKWHLEGVFVPAGSAPSPAPSQTGGTSPAPAVVGKPTAGPTAGPTASGSPAATPADSASPTTAAKAASQPAAGQSLPAGTTLVKSTTWEPTWWLLALTISIAVLGIGALAVGPILQGRRPAGAGK